VIINNPIPKEFLKIFLSADNKNLFLAFDERKDKGHQTDQETLGLVYDIRKGEWLLPARAIGIWFKFINWVDNHSTLEIENIPYPEKIDIMEE